jgi:integrase
MAATALVKRQGISSGWRLHAKGDTQSGLLTSAKLNHEWRAARELIGSPDLRVHDMRHEATSRLFEDKGMNVIEVSSITGHKSLQMLKRYANLNPELLAKKLG